MHDRGKNGISRIVDTHLGQPQGQKENEEIKEYSYVEQACSNIDMHKNS